MGRGRKVITEFETQRYAKGKNDEQKKKTLCWSTSFLLTRFLAEKQETSFSYFRDQRCKTYAARINKLDYFCEVKGQIICDYSLNKRKNKPFKINLKTIKFFKIFLFI